MLSDTPSYVAYGFGSEVQSIDNDMYDLFKPEPGHWLIIWPHGLMTFRDSESFGQDFTHRSGTVFETPLKALFQEGMTNPEYLANKALERKKQALENKQYQTNLKPRSLVLCGSEVVVRTVVPGLLPPPEGMSIPLHAHIPILPVLIKIKLPDLE